MFFDKGASLQLPLLVPSHVALCQLMPVAQRASCFLPLSDVQGLETDILIPFLFDARHALFKLRRYFGLDRRRRHGSKARELSPDTNFMKLSEAMRQFLFYELGRPEFLDSGPSDDAGLDDVLDSHDNGVVELQQALLSSSRCASPNSPFRAGVINFLAWAHHLVAFTGDGNFEGRRGRSSNFGIMRASSILALALELQLMDRANQVLENENFSHLCSICLDSLPLRFRYKLSFFVIVEKPVVSSGICHQRAIQLGEMLSLQDYSKECQSEKDAFTKKYALHFLTWDDWILTLEPRHRQLLDSPPWNWRTDADNPLQADMSWKADGPSSFQLWWRSWRELVLQGLQEAAGRLQRAQSTDQSEVTPEHAGLEMLTAVDRFAHTVVQEEDEDFEPLDFSRIGDTDPNSFPLLVARVARLWQDFTMSEWHENPYLNWQVSGKLAEAAIYLGFEDFADLQMEVRKQIRGGELDRKMDLGHPDAEQPS